jgi:cobyrinic acid a,c-diamide synthase
MKKILFAAPKSGSGKTMVTCAVLSLLKKRGLKIKAFKCGPDYIDAMFHRKVLGIPSGNLDTFFTDAEMTRYIFHKGCGGCDIAVIEGVMGYYDGLGGDSTEGSTYEIAATVGTPVILIVDAKGASLSLAAMIRGMVEYRSDSNIAGVILNRVSASYYERLKNVVEAECGLKVFGYVPELKELSVPSRHLGLVGPDEILRLQEWSDMLSDKLAQTIDIGGILETADVDDNSEEEYFNNKNLQNNNEWDNIPKLTTPVKIAVARDEAFSFYYQENLDLLNEMGAKTAEFSPLKGEHIPEGSAGLILGGGYPENYIKQLEKSYTTAEIADAIRNGMPCLAECGGFLYLQKSLEDKNGEKADMAGIFDGEGFYAGRLTRFGYVELESRKSGLLGNAGEIIKGHEFHHFDCTENGSDFIAHKHKSKKEDYCCMIHTDTIAAGFPHLYYYSNPDAVYNFLEKAAEYQARKQAHDHWEKIAKPLDSLGMLEADVTKICGIYMNAGPENHEKIKKRALLTFCADHGVVCEGVTQTGKDVTRIVSENFAKGKSSVNYMAAVAGVDVYAVDVGMDTDEYPESELKTGIVVNRKIRRGTGNIAIEPAMTEEECRQALNTGTELVGQLKSMGYGMAATGEMGIGNTTPTSVLAALYLGLDAEDVAGRGAGLSDEAFIVKKNVIKKAIERVKNQINHDRQTMSPNRATLQNKQASDEAFKILAQAGGLEIAAMAGAFLGGVKYRMPIVIDGAISSVAALAAYRMDNRVKNFAFASHESEEITGRLALEEMGLKAPLHAEMRLGEGTGAMALFPLLDMGMAVYTNMGSFDDYNIESYKRF